MGEKDQIEIARISAQLMRLESRLQAFERAFYHDRRILRRLARRSWAEKFRPLIWEFDQYEPRPIFVPETYKADRAPANAPRIAIVTPSLNQARFVKSTIDSVLAQEYPNLDYLVQDGGSTDDTVSILQSYGPQLNWRTLRDGGQAIGLNRGFAAVVGDIMAYLNSDDVLLPGALAYVARIFAARPDIDLIYGHRIVIDSDGQEMGRIILPRHDPIALKWFDYVPQESLFWRRRVWDKIGLFDERFQFAIDWEFILRAQNADFRFNRVPRFLACFRSHAEQKTIRIRQVCDEETRCIWMSQLGFEPTPRQFERATKGYLRRHVIANRLYKLGVLQ